MLRLWLVVWVLCWLLRSPPGTVLSPVSSLGLRPVSVSAARAAWLPGCLAQGHCGVGGWCHFMTSRTLFYSVPGLNKQKRAPRDVFRWHNQGYKCFLGGYPHVFSPYLAPDSAAWLGPASLESQCLSPPTQTWRGWQAPIIPLLPLPLSDTYLLLSLYKAVMIHRDVITWPQSHTMISWQTFLRHWSQPSPSPV